MLNLCMLFSAFLGYYLLLFICKKGKDTAFYPAVIVSGVVVMGFCAGLLNQMKIAYMLIYGIGLLLLVGAFIAISFHKCSLPKISAASIFPFLYFCLGSFVLLLLFKDRFLFSYDDFSHWGRAAQVLSVNQRLPIAEDSLLFTSYPVGSALFIAYCANILGNSADAYLFSQALLLFCFYISLFSASDKLWSQVCIALIIMLFMQYNVSLEILCVDNLLAAAATAGIMMCLNLKKSGSNSLFELTLVLSALTLIKNSGFFLAVVILGYALFLCKKGEAFKWKHVYLLLPIAVLVLWNIHTASTFANPSKHALSVRYYLSVLVDKRLGGIKTTLAIILPLLFNPSANFALQLIPGYLLSLVLLWRSKHFEKYKSVFLFASVLFVVYEIGVLLMYVLSMPTSEVVFHEGRDYSRYNGTVEAILAAILLYLLCMVIHEYPIGSLKKAIGVFICCAILCVNIVHVLSLKYIPLETVESRYASSPTAAKLMQVSEENTFPHGASCIVLYDMPDSAGYHYYLSNYYLQTADIVHCYDQETAIKEYSENPQKYYIDLCTGTVSAPKE